MKKLSTMTMTELVDHFNTLAAQDAEATPTTRFPTKVAGIRRILAVTDRVSRANKEKAIKKHEKAVEKGKVVIQTAEDGGKARIKKATPKKVTPLAGGIYTLTKTEKAVLLVAMSGEFTMKQVKKATGTKKKLVKLAIVNLASFGMVDGVTKPMNEKRTWRITKKGKEAAKVSSKQMPKAVKGKTKPGSKAEAARNLWAEIVTPDLNCTRMDYINEGNATGIHTRTLVPMWGKLAKEHGIVDATKKANEKNKK